MKLVHVVPDVSVEAAGPSYAVPRLCASLAARGHDVELVCLAAAGAIPGVRVDLHARWPVAARFEISWSLARALRRRAEEVDVVHNHSLWSMANVAAGWMVPGRRARLVTSPHGTLSQWALARRRGAKRILWPLQRPALERASLLHATSAEECRDIRALGLRAPIAIVPNGIDLPVLGPRPESPQRTLLFLGRIHPVKGVDRLLHAWQALQQRHPHWRLVVAGPGKSRYVREVRELAATLHLLRVEFVGALYGNAKSRAYLEADLFVLPSRSENFGMTVAEALAHECPAVVSDAAPWSGLATEGCGWRVGPQVPELAATLDAAMSLPAETLRAMGRLGRAWMERDFGWDSVALRMEAAYRWALEGGKAPAWINL